MSGLHPAHTRSPPAAATAAAVSQVGERLPPKQDDYDQGHLKQDSDLDPLYSIAEGTKGLESQPTLTSSLGSWATIDETNLLDGDL